MSARLLVLGGGYQQLPLVEHCLERGARVVVADSRRDPPAAALATEVCRSDPRDPDSMVRLVRDMSLDGVVSIGSDVVVPSVLAANGLLGRSCLLPPARAQELMSKAQVSRVLRRANICVPDDLLVKGPEVPPVDRGALAGPPWVVKPDDAQGQKGISVVQRPGALHGALDAARAASGNGAALIQPVIGAPEVTVSAWCEHGRVVAAHVADRLRVVADGSFGIAFRHVSPSECWEVGVALARDLAAALGVDTGPLYVQFLDSDIGPVVVDVALRVGGGYEAVHWPAATAFPILDRLLDAALGSSPPQRQPEPDVSSLADIGVVTTFVIARPGTVEHLDPIQASTDKAGFLSGMWMIRPDQQVPVLADGTGRVGVYSVTGGTREAALAAADDHYSALSLRNDSGENLITRPEFTS